MHARILACERYAFEAIGCCRTGPQLQPQHVQQQKSGTHARPGGYAVCSCKRPSASSNAQSTHGVAPEQVRWVCQKFQFVLIKRPLARYGTRQLGQVELLSAIAIRGAGSVVAAVAPAMRCVAAGVVVTVAARTAVVRVATAAEH
eukprot:363353-Chlamydomonas_euryale.AAC.10